jgi:predicted tellurium resistance membrane protein TerC
MWRLIGLAVILAVFLGFIGLNLDNRSVISFGFWETAEPVPVFLPVFAAFVLGIICSIPFVISVGVKRSRKNKGRENPASKKKRGKDETFPETPVVGGPYDID